MSDAADFPGPARASTSTDDPTRTPARDALRFLLHGPSTRPTRRELLFIAIMLVLYGSVVRVERSTWPVATPAGPTLQEVLAGANRGNRPSSAANPLPDVSRCSLDIRGEASTVMFLRTRIGVYAWVDMTLSAPPYDRLRAGPLNERDQQAIERLLRAYVPCARTALGARTSLHGHPGTLRFRHGPIVQGRSGRIALVRASGGDAWLGPWFTMLRAGFWLGWLLIALLVLWLFRGAVNDMAADIRNERLRAGLCPRCRYNLRDGGLTRCPECGTDTLPTADPRRISLASPDP